MNYRWSAEEERQLRAMREELRDDLVILPQYPDVVGDRRLLRFLRARALDLDKAVLLYRRFLAFRREYQVDTIHERICKSRTLVWTILIDFTYSAREFKCAASLSIWRESAQPHSSDSKYYQRP